MSSVRRAEGGGQVVVLVVTEAEGVLPAVELGVDPLGQRDAVVGGLDDHPPAVVGVGQTAHEPGLLEPVEGERHAAGGAAEHVADGGGGAAVVRRAPDHPQHQVVGDADAGGTDDPVEHAIHRHVEADDVAEQTVGAGQLVGRHYFVMPKRCRP